MASRNYDVQPITVPGGYPIPSAVTTMMKSLKEQFWSRREGASFIKVIDSHAAGEPLRVIVDGFPEIPGTSVLDRRRYVKKHLDHLRTALMFEPRGHADMYGCLVMPPVTDGADCSVLFLHNEGYSTMCGHGIVAFTTVAFETGMFSSQESESRLEIDTPAGRVSATAEVEGGHVTAVRFTNVPSWVEALDAVVDVPGLGQVRYDLAFGGAYYAFVQSDSVDVSIRPEQTGLLIDLGRRIKKAVAEEREIHHPFEEDLGFLYGTIFVGPSDNEGVHSRNVCIFADGEVDRSPTGTGVSARAAIHHARGELRLGQAMTIESIIGSRFSVRLVREISFGPHSAVVPEVEGTAFITGFNTLVLDPKDPFKDGFFLR